MERLRRNNHIQPGLNSSRELRYLGELCVYPFGKGFLLNWIVLIYGTKTTGVSKLWSGWHERSRTPTTVKDVFCFLFFRHQMRSDAVVLLNGNYGWRLWSSIIDGTLDKCTHKSQPDIFRWWWWCKKCQKVGNFYKTNERAVWSSLPVPSVLTHHCAPGRYSDSDRASSLLLSCSCLFIKWFKARYQWYTGRQQCSLFVCWLDHNLRRHMSSLHLLMMVNERTLGPILQFLRQSTHLHMPEKSIYNGVRQNCPPEGTDVISLHSPAPTPITHCL